MTQFDYFNSGNFYHNASRFFTDLNIPVNSIEDQAYKTKDFLSKTYNKDSVAQSLIEHIYLIGMVDDDAFSGNAKYNSLAEINNVNTDYAGLVIVGVELKSRENNLLPTRTQLAEITRIINREFEYTPVTVLFKYEHYLALANAERTTYVAKHKEGEKVGKVSLLRDINYQETHTGHWQIIEGLKISSKIDTFKALDNQWNSVFSVNVLNKKFYQELSNWYFWAVKNVTFPGEPTLDDASLQGKEYKDLQQEHKATNVIRMLTRLLFVWFMKEKKLIPEDLFDLDAIKKDILNEISPYQEVGMFTEHNKDSVYYKAILQNLFFATLNCPIKSDGVDKRERGFRGEGYGTNRGIDYLLRYKKYFKSPDEFLTKLNEVVPFLNGGLFECLDDKFNNKYIDGFSDNMSKGEQLIVPDYLFFGLEEEADLSEVIGIADKKNKNAAVKGLINILKSYKFTITENTPIEEEVALDPELLGKVFENLLASYNPETKTTARKQTGSFYTPREIVNYMVDESLIAYLKNKIQSAETVQSELGTGQSNLFGNEHKIGQTSLMEQHSGSELKDNDERLNDLLHILVSFNSENPFEAFPKTSKIILEELDKCTILDPACGSGAFPMGVLQKMVHILEKLDPENRIWKEVQIDKAKKASDEAFDIENKQTREDRLIEINDAFDEDVNNPDYARKLFLIENCIYGVDIQPIATQISKLRFFISLVVEQNVDRSKINFGIRPLPNLETKFVAANTLIGIEKENTLFSTDEIKVLEQKLKKVRNKLFGARTKETKLKYRELDKNLRLEIADKLKENGFPVASAEKLASWDPFDQNASSSFFDPEWMYDIKEGFDIVIGNPPYVQIKQIPQEDKPYYISNFKFATGRFNLFYFFIEISSKFTKKHGFTSYIIPDRLMLNTQCKQLRSWLLNDQNIISIDSFDESVFDSAVVDSIILNYRNSKNEDKYIKSKPNSGILNINEKKSIKIPVAYFNNSSSKQFDLNYSLDTSNLLNKIKSNSKLLGEIAETRDGIIQSKIKDVLFLNLKENKFCEKLLFGKDVNRFDIKFKGNYVNYQPDEMMKIEVKRGGGGLRLRNRIIFEREKILTRQTSDQIIGAIDFENFFYSNTLHGTTITDLKFNIKYVLALMNSKVVNFYYKQITSEGGKVFAQVKIEILRQLPIKFIVNQDSIVNLVNEIIKLRQNEVETCDLETRLNHKIYKIYGLNFEEVKIIDPEFSLSETEYEALEF